MIPRFREGQDQVLKCFQFALKLDEHFTLSDVKRIVAESLLNLELSDYYRSESHNDSDVAENADELTTTDVSDTIIRLLEDSAAMGNPLACWDLVQLNLHSIQSSDYTPDPVKAFNYLRLCGESTDPLLICASASKIQKSYFWDPLSSQLESIYASDHPDAKALRLLLHYLKITFSIPCAISSEFQRGLKASLDRQSQGKVQRFVQSLDLLFQNPPDLSKAEEGFRCSHSSKCIPIRHLSALYLARTLCLARKPFEAINALEKLTAIPHAYTTSVTAYKKHHTQGAATAAYVLRYVIFPKNSTIYHEHTKYIRLRTLVIPRGLMKRGELLKN